MLVSLLPSFAHHENQFSPIARQIGKAGNQSIGIVKSKEPSCHPVDNQFAAAMLAG
jgi:hypothetical protein